MSEKRESFSEQKAAMDRALEEAKAALNWAEASVERWPDLTAEIAGELTPALRRAASRLRTLAWELGGRAYLRPLRKVRARLARLRGITWRDRRAVRARLWDVVILPYIAWLRLRVWVREHRRQILFALVVTACIVALVLATVWITRHWSLIRAFLLSVGEFMRK